MPLANVNSPLGFRLLKRGGQQAVKRIERPVAAGRTANLMIGDAYGLDANGAAFRAVGTEGESTSNIRGIVEGFRLHAIEASPQGPVSQDYIPDNEAGWIIGIEDEQAEFVVQANTFAVTDTGGTFDLSNASGDNVALRQSRQFLDVAGGSATQFKIVDLLQSPADNSVGAFAKVVVKIASAVL